LINGEKDTYIRVGDLWGVIPSITGKVELVYEGEQEGPVIVAQNLIGKAMRTQFLLYFPDPEKLKKQQKNKADNPYRRITDWFGEGNTIDLLNDSSNKDYKAALNNVKGLRELVDQYHARQDDATKLFLMEFALHGLAEYSMISKNQLTAGLQFKDLLSSMFSGPGSFGDDDEDDDTDDKGRGGRKYK
jgi:magnesium chelatase subunit I